MDIQVARTPSRKEKVGLEGVNVGKEVQLDEVLLEMIQGRTPVGCATVVDQVTGG